MSPTDPFRISARAALRAGGRDLLRAPLPTALALLGTLAALLAGQAAWLRAAELLNAAAPGRAAAAWLSGMALAALLLDGTRAVALCAYASPPSPLLRLVRLGLARTPGLISVRAVELLLYFCLAIGDAFVLASGPIHFGSGPMRLALAALVALAPSLLLAVVVFAASRVAQTLIARGMAPAAALARGYDLVLRRFASLARLALAGGLVTAPLVALALLLPFGVRELLLGLTALFFYAALTRLVGSDGRLLTG
jgi:hypothetical protein